MSAVLRPRPLLIRPMQEGDVPAVIEIEEAAYRFPWTAGIVRDCLQVGYSCCVVEEHGRLCGYGVLSVAAGESHILNLCVHPVDQGKGIGRRILLHLLRLARRRGADTVILEVRPSNEPALALYRSQGFNEVGLRRDYYPASRGREDAVVLARTLLFEGV